MMTSQSNIDVDSATSCGGKKRVRRGESFGRTGVDRTISNSLKSPCRQKLKQQSVRFTAETPIIHLCSNFSPNMTTLEVMERKRELWYSRNDFEDFLRDRISTIQLLKAVQGDAVALRKHCPDMCLRGLEPYQCDTLNLELQCQRHMHQRVVLTEQTLQKQYQREQCDPEAIRRLAQGQSEWARQRAQQLAALDELEVNPESNADRAVSRRLSLTSTAQLGLESLMLTQRRQERTASLSSLPQLSTSRRVPVDLAILKEWNAMFLQDIRQKNGVAHTKTASLLSTNAPKSLSEKTAESRRALEEGFRTTLSGGNLGVGSPTTGTSTLGYGESLALSKEVSTMDTDLCFLARRDSLLVLRRESFLASRAAASTTGTTNAPPSSSPMCTLAAVAAAVSAGGSLSDACFRFPTRRDSLSNVQWT